MVGVEFVALGNFSAPPQGVDPADVDLGIYNIGKPVAYPGMSTSTLRAQGRRRGPQLPMGHVLADDVVLPRESHPPTSVCCRSRSSARQRAVISKDNPAQPAAHGTSPTKRATSASRCSIIRCVQRVKCAC